MTALLRTESFNRLSKEVFWVVLGQGMAVLGSLVGIRILTGMLDPSAYGEIALGMTAVAFVNRTVFGSLSDGASRFYSPAAEGKDLGGYLNAIRLFALWATGIVVLLIPLVIGGLFVTARAEWVAFAIVAIVFIILNGNNSILSEIQNAARHRFVVAFHQGMESWVIFLAAAGLIVLFGASSTMVMAGYVVGAMVVLGSQYVFFRKTISVQATKVDCGRDWVREIWNYSWPFLTWGIFTVVHSVSGRWALGIFSTTKDVGMYAVLYQLGHYPMAIFIGIVTQFLAPIFYQRTGDASDSRRSTDVIKLSWRLAAITLGVMGAAFVISFLFHSQIYNIFAAKQYASVSHLLPWIMFASGVLAAGEILTLNLKSQMKTKTMARSEIILALLGIGLNFTGAYSYGITGIAVASVVFSTIYFLWMLSLSKLLYLKAS